MTRSRHGSVIPTMRYVDAAAAIEWLCQAQGFEKHLVVPGDDGSITHAQLTIENGMIMVGSAREDEFGQMMTVPGPGGRNTQSVYIVVQDPDAHYERARRAGAEIVMAIRDEDYGGRHYSCRDPEGHVWNFGSYDPWA
ncbi:MAG: VOC family protein [Geminicoccaceae bacterium]